MQPPAARCQPPGAPVLVCFALKGEAVPFRKIAAGKSESLILITGIGHENANKSVRGFLVNNSPEYVLTCGFAGGLNPDLKLGEVVFEIPKLDFELQIPNPEVHRTLLAAGARPARFFCTGRIAVTIAEKRKLREETGADAVEMESEAIRTVCRERGIPCATVRVISDTANEDLPLDFNRFSKPDNRLDYGKLFWFIALSPGKTGGLLRLQKNCRLAAERLAEVLGKIIFP